LKFPRDVSGEKLAKLLSKFGFKITRQTGSHIRLTSFLKGEYHITIPNHDPIKIGTFNNILSEIAGYLEIDKNELITKLFG
jgi:predicted RNA binding protein YcfA (HicA-like mRNA interferase family)